MIKHITQKLLPIAIAALLIAPTVVAQTETAPDAGVYAGQQVPRQTQTPIPTQHSKAKAPVKKQTVETLEAVQVVGLRASAESAVSRQRFSPQIMESIVAQGIGKLPDTNAADALSRLPGIQITQDQGEGSTVTISRAH